MSARQSRPVVLLRPVPGDSAVHRLWAGTKLVVVLGASILLALHPGWITIAAVAAVVVIGVVVAGIPGVLPSIPWWFGLLFALGGLATVVAGGDPVVQLASVPIGLGGLLSFLRLTALAVVLLALGAMVSWTTNVAEIAPAVVTLGRPLRWTRLPIDEWAVTLSLALRAFPMLLEEFKVLAAARRLRPRPATADQPRRRGRVRDLVDVLVAAVTVSMRRADEMGDAITARGGTGQIAAAPARPKRADWVTLALLGALGAAVVVLETTLGGG